MAKSSLEQHAKNKCHAGFILSSVPPGVARQHAMQSKLVYDAMVLEFRLNLFEECLASKHVSKAQSEWCLRQVIC